MRQVLTVHRFTELARLRWKRKHSPGTTLQAMYLQLAKKWRVSLDAVKKLRTVALRNGLTRLDVDWFDTVTIDDLVSARIRFFKDSAAELEEILDREQLLTAYCVSHELAPRLLALALAHARLHSNDQALAKLRVLEIVREIQLPHKLGRFVQSEQALEPEDTIRFTAVTQQASGAIDRVKCAFIGEESIADWRSLATRQRLAESYAKGELLASKLVFNALASDCAVEAFLIEPIVGKKFLKRLQNS